jgi:hypothetical protein
MNCGRGYSGVQDPQPHLEADYTGFRNLESRLIIDCLQVIKIHPDILT